MIKRTITFEDYNGNMVTEDFYFHISKAEWARFMVRYPGGIEQWSRSVQQSHSPKELFALFEDMVSMAYGIKSPDGRQFHKSPEITKQFTETEAYSDMIIEFISDTDKAIEFFSELFNVKDADVKKVKESVKSELSIV